MTEHDYGEDIQELFERQDRQDKITGLALAAGLGSLFLSALAVLNTLF